MTKKAKIIVFLLCLSVVLLLYLILTSEPKAKFPQAIMKIEQNQLTKVEQLEADYTREVKPIFAELVELINQQKYTNQEVSRLKQQLLNLIVPTKFKNLHLDLFLAIIKMENYLASGKSSEKIESQQLINQAKADYNWLNDKL